MLILVAELVVVVREVVLVEVVAAKQKYMCMLSTVEKFNCL